MRPKRPTILASAGRLHIALASGDFGVENQLASSASGMTSVCSDRSGVFASASSRKWCRGAIQRETCLYRTRCQGFVLGCEICIPWWNTRSAPLLRIARLHSGRSRGSRIHTMSVWVCSRCRLSLLAAANGRCRCCRGMCRMFSVVAEADSASGVPCTQLTSTSCPHSTIHWAYRMRLRSNPPQPVELERKAILIGGRDER